MTLLIVLYAYLTEPIPIPDPTLSETLLALVWNTVEKAVYLHVNDEALLYDTAYVEISKAVEEAMEIPVLEIKEDIATLFYNAYKYFEIDIMEKERIGKLANITFRFSSFVILLIAAENLCSYFFFNKFF